MTIFPPVKAPLDVMVKGFLMERGIEVHPATHLPALEEGPAFWTVRVVPGIGIDPTVVMGTKAKQLLKLRLGLPASFLIRAFIDQSCVVFEIPKKDDERQIVDAATLWHDAKDLPRNELVATFGVDMRGAPISINFSSSKSPHLLIGGTTGSGKSVALEVILQHLVDRYDETELGLWLIDPKGTELAHLESEPQTRFFATSAREAMLVLRKGYVEMEARYDRFSGSGKRSILEYNAELPIVDLTPKRKPAPPPKRSLWRRQPPAPPAPQRVTGPAPRMPWWVIVLDEYADLAMSDHADDIRRFTLQLAQKSRAAGIHLVLATQRPSAKVLDTTIRANLPAALALRVKTAADSRIILDESGAELLAGAGDALFRTAKGTRRVQCALLQRH